MKKNINFSKMKNRPHHHHLRTGCYLPRPQANSNINPAFIYAFKLESPSAFITFLQQLEL